jgi:hypothetical protein
VPEDDQGSIVVDRLPALSARICRKFAALARLRRDACIASSVLASMARAIRLFVGRESLREPLTRQCARACALVLLKNGCTYFSALLCSRALAGEGMTKAETQARVLEEWFRLPESRRRYATDAVAFAYRLLRDHPELLGPKEIGYESIVNWLLPHLTEAKTG